MISFIQIIWHWNIIDRKVVRKKLWNKCGICDILAYMFFFNDFQFLVSHVHKFHIFVAVFLISMSHVHVSHHIIYLYKVIPIKCVSLEVSCSYWSKLKYFKNWNNMNQKIRERNFTEFGWIKLFYLIHNILRFFLRKFSSP